MKAHHQHSAEDGHPAFVPRTFVMRDCIKRYTNLYISWKLFFTHVTLYKTLCPQIGDITANQRNQLSIE